MNVRPLHDRIIVRRLDEGEQKIGGIIIPDSAKEKPQKGRVISAGDGKINEDGSADYKIYMPPGHKVWALMNTTLMREGVDT